MSEGQRTEIGGQPPCISAAPAALDRYLAASPAMSLIPVAPFIKITASQGGQPPAPEGAYAPVGSQKSEAEGAYSVNSGTFSSSYFWMRTPSTSMSEASGWFSFSATSSVTRRI